MHLKYIPKTYFTENLNAPALCGEFARFNVVNT